MASGPRKDRVQINFLASRKLTAYLYDLAEEEGMGSNPTAVVQHLTWEGIRRQIRDGIIEPRRGPMGGDSEGEP